MLASGSSDLSTFIDNLTEQERMLVVLKRELYEGRWDAMLSDLKNRLDGRPYVFKLVNRIREDIERIARLREFESRCDIDLADYVRAVE